MPAYQFSTDDLRRAVARAELYRRTKKLDGEPLSYYAKRIGVSYAYLKRQIKGRIHEPSDTAEA